MLLNKKMDYALRITAYIAKQRERISSTRLSKAVNIPIPTLRGVCTMLTIAGILKAKEGIKGGYVLAKPAAATTAYDIISAVGKVKIWDCAHCREDCDQHAYLYGLEHFILTSLQATTIDTL